MPITPNIEEIFLVEETYETVFKTIFTRKGGISNVDKSREKNDAKTPRAEIAFITGKVTGKKQALIGDGQALIYSGWLDSELRVSVITNRQTNGAEHKTMLAKVRKWCSLYFLASVWKECHPSLTHLIADIRESGSIATSDKITDVDTTTVIFRIAHNVNPSAFIA